jgi:hypothetical protein
MSRIIALLIANFFVVDYGVVPDGKDNSVYVIQIEPEVAKQLLEGYVIESVIPPELHGIRKFRIQIGNEKLVKPIPLVPALEGNESSPVIIPDPSVTNPDGKSEQDPVEEATGIDVDTFPLKSTASPGESAVGDAFPLQPESEQNQSPERALLLPEKVESEELPGIPVGVIEEGQNVLPSLEPDSTTLPPLTGTLTVVGEPALVTEQSDAEEVIVPVFDKPDSDIAVDGLSAIEQVEVPTLDLLDNFDSANRIVLGELPDLVAAPDENAESAEVDENEPELLEDDPASFVKLATATSSGDNITVANSPDNASNPLPIESRSWPLFSITLLGLLVSVGGNVYLGMTVLDFYRKSRRLAVDIARPSDAD